MKLNRLALAITLAFQQFAFAAEDHIPKGYKLIYEQTFENPDTIQQFQMTDANAWKFSKEEKGGALELAAQSKYKPEVRSPVNIALIKEKVFGDFILEADLIQTGREYGHRDMCLFFGFQNPKQFYYAHIATKADPNAHNIFLVNNAPRTNIAKTTTTGVSWGLNIWHKVRLERKIADGSIKVYFDDMTIPIMVAEDKNFGPGFIGFGSFDDTGKVDNIKIWGPQEAKSKTPIEFATPAAAK
ncbi:MAG: hypothetical protein ACXW32_14255 [Limisphaerales bacterium]